MEYNPAIEQFVDGIDFNADSPCIWIVYPPGTAGDLLASIVNFHFVETGARFKGINDQGQVIFRPSDNKHTNLLARDGLLNFDRPFFYKIADVLSSANLNWSKMDQFIFSNHCYSSGEITKILSSFSHCKIIRLIPKSFYEQQLVNWLADLKNNNIIGPVPDHNLKHVNYQIPNINDQRLLTIYFSDFINKEKFESVYQSITNHLSLPCKLIRYDFIDFWLSKQHILIQDSLKRIAYR